MNTKGFAEFSTQATEQALSALRQAQDWSLEATEAFVANVGDRPSPSAAVAWSFDTAQKVLEQQRGYMLRLTQMLTPGSAASGSS